MPSVHVISVVEVLLLLSSRDDEEEDEEEEDEEGKDEEGKEEEQDRGRLALAVFT